MVKEGIMDTFEFAQVYGIHNAPGLEAGRFYTAVAVDGGGRYVSHSYQGVGGHGAMPHETRDPVMQPAP